MKNIKQQFKKIGFPLLGEYTTLLIGTKKSDHKMYYAVEFDMWIPYVWRGTEGTKSGEAVWNYDQLSRLITKMQKLGAKRAEITAIYGNPKGPGCYLDSKIVLVFVDGDWKVESVEFL